MTDLTIYDLTQAATGTQVRDRDGSVWVKSDRGSHCWRWQSPGGLFISLTSRWLVYELAPITEVTP